MRRVLLGPGAVVLCVIGLVAWFAATGARLWMVFWFAAFALVPLGILATPFVWILYTNGKGQGPLARKPVLWRIRWSLILLSPLPILIALARFSDWVRVETTDRLAVRWQVSTDDAERSRLLAELEAPGDIRRVSALEATNELSYDLILLADRMEVHHASSGARSESVTPLRM